MGIKTVKQMEADFPPGAWDPAPTAPNGGLPRMLKIWEKLRELNTGGYGSHRLAQIDGWSAADKRAIKVTSCSPFTATAIGMMFDQKESGVEKAKWEPMYDDGKKPLPSIFYWHHNGDFRKYYATKDFFEKHKKSFRYGHPEIENSAISCVFWGLGYEIDPRDMRRGDMVGINWGNNNGHATFCWDVHLNASGAVDAFQYLSSNSTQGGIGVSVAASVPNLIVKSGDKWKANDTVFKDRDEYISRGMWHLLPSKYLDGQKFDPTSFKFWPELISWQGDYSVASLKVCRFWGFPAPKTPHGNAFVEADEALRMYRLHKFDPPEPEIIATGTASKKGAKPAKSKPTPKSNPEPKKAVPPTPIQQQKQDAQPFQLWVEMTLSTLYAAKWIDKDPGQADSVADAQSKAAIEDFQKKWKFSPADGLASPEVRKLMKQALDDLQAGKPNPNDTKRKPEIESFYFTPNAIEPGDSIKLGVTGKNLDLIKKYDLTITDDKGASEKKTLEMQPKHDIASTSLDVPEKFVAGSTLKLEISGEGVKKSSNAVLTIKKPAPRSSEWPWDEKHWPKHVQDMLAQLRATPKGKGNYVKRNITQYGIWDRVPDGDVPILDKKGRTMGHTDRKSLYLADIAGAMRVNGKILNLIESGNVFDPRAGTAIYERFDPKRSRWIDVCKDAPWGMGAKMPLIPFRTLAYNASREKDLYGKKVYIQQLDAVKLPSGEIHNGICIIGDAGSMEPEKQFDLFVGPEGRRVSIPPQCNVEIL